ncbi:MAG TPA: imidazole glycerol phosphate synthase subunit HisH [Propionibacteriaceae bacterium]|nr:imidazole glycerol phosphate synthase subunit HisH [Propionibacteriaceae bacterium]
MSRPPKVGLLDYGSGNLHSARRALEATGADVRVSVNPADFDSCDGLVVPGVGAFAACMAGLASVGGDELVRSWLQQGRRLLGICVGHQILFDAGVEHGTRAAGLGIFPGTVERLNAERLPHMGWNTVQPPHDTVVFAGVAHERFYFVHSYGVHAPDGLGAGVRVTTASHGGDTFVAACESELVSSTQFHPEKSGEAGARLLSSWVATLL